MGLSIAQYGHAQFNSEIASFGGGNRGAAANRRGGRAEAAPEEKAPEQRLKKLERKQAELAAPAEVLTENGGRRELVPLLLDKPRRPDSDEETSVRAPERLKASSRASSSESELQFQVKTAEGDTVTLSVRAAQQSSVDKVSYKSEDGSLKVSQRTESSSLQASLAVEGDLSEEELADITKALESLSQGKDLEDLGTLESASFQYSNRTIYTQSRLSFVG